MKRLKQAVFLPLLLIIMVLTTSWGFLVHRTVNQLAVYELPEPMQPFFYSNMNYLVANAPRPDLRRNDDSTEATKHFIDLEIYEKNSVRKMPLDWKSAVAQYSSDTLLKYGYVPYHIIYMKEKLTMAFRSGNKDSILFYAADIGHYIGDAHVPLHTSENYDGQLTNQKGLHSLWESMIPELEIGNYDLYSAHQATYLKDPTQAIWKTIRSGFDMVPELLEKELEVSKGFTDAEKFRVQIRRGKETKSYTTAFAKAYAAALKQTINQRLKQSVDMIADFWYTSWVDAGKPVLSKINQGWDENAGNKLKEELKAFQQNELLKQSLLIAKKIQENTNN